MRVATFSLVLIVLALSAPAQARGSGVPGQYAIRCYAAECYDRYHDRQPKSERAPRSSFGRSRSSRY